MCLPDIGGYAPQESRNRPVRYQGDGTFRQNRAGQPAISVVALCQVAAAGQALTYTCAPPGAGVRMALDRDMDGALNGDEEDAGTDPADPASTPAFR
jgi:hypothetical protein